MAEKIKQKREKIKEKPLSKEVTRLILTENEVIEPEVIDPDIREELQLKIIDEVFSKKDIELKTEYSDDQIIAFAKGSIFSTRYNSQTMAELMRHISERSVSKGRKGRKEFTEISKSLGAYNEPDDIPVQRIRDRLLGN